MVIEMLLLAWVWKDVVAGIELGVEKINIPYPKVEDNDVILRQVLADLEITKPLCI